MSQQLLKNTKDSEAPAQESSEVVMDLELQKLRDKVTVPFLPPLDKSKIPQYAYNLNEVYTLVLDLDETLIHF